MEAAVVLGDLVDNSVDFLGQIGDHEVFGFVQLEHELFFVLGELFLQINKHVVHVCFDLLGNTHPAFEILLREDDDVVKHVFIALLFGQEVLLHHRVLDVELALVLVLILERLILDVLKLVADHVDHEVVQDDEADHHVDAPDEPDHCFLAQGERILIVLGVLDVANGVSHGLNGDAEGLRHFVVVFGVEVVGAEVLQDQRLHQREDYQQTEERYQGHGHVSHKLDEFPPGVINSDEQEDVDDGQ